MQLDMLDNDEIDRQFAALAEDDEYQTFQIELAESFAENDWDACVQAERILKIMLDL